MKLHSGSPGKYVRKKNKNGNFFYQDRESGKRVSKEKWTKERKNIQKKVSKNRQEQEIKISKIREQGVSSPFPHGVDERGVPQKRAKTAGSKGSKKNVHKTLTGRKQDSRIDSRGAAAVTRSEAGRPLVEVPSELEGEAVDLGYDEEFVPFAIEGEDETG